MVFTCRAPRNGDLPGFPFQRAMDDNPDWSHLGDHEPVFVQNEVLRHLKRLTSLPFLENRELRPLVEEVVIGCIQVTQRLLERLGIHLFQPDVFRKLFKICKFGRCIVIGQHFASFSIVVNLPSQEVVEHKPGTSEVSGEDLLLFLVRVDPVFEGLMHHIYNYK